MDKKPELLKNLPPDIKKVIFFRQFRYTAFFVIWYSAIYFGIYKYVVSSGLEKIPFQNIIIMFFILGAIPFIVFQFKKIFLESTYCGVIAEIKAVGYWGGTALVKRSVKAENTTYAKITIYLDNGKKKILILENNDGRHTTYYKKVTL